MEFDGRRQSKLAGKSLAKITVAHLAECLARSGFVVMEVPLVRDHSSTEGPGRLAD